MSIAIHFRLVASKSQRKADAPVMIKCYVSCNSERERVFSTGFRCLPSRFSVKAQRVVGKELTPGEKALNDYLKKIHSDLTQFFIELKFQEDEFSTMQFLDKFNQRHAPTPAFLDIWTDYLEHTFKNKDLESTTKGKYQRAKDFFAEYMISKKFGNFYAYSVTKEVIENYYLYLQLRTNQFGEKIDELHAYRLTKHIAHVLDFAVMKGYLKYNRWKQFQINYPGDKHKAILALTDEELLRIYHLQHLSDTQRKITDAFLVMAYTGLTYADYCLFATEPKKYLIEDESGKLFVEQARFKNRKQRRETVPYIFVFPIVFEILNRYEFALPVYANQVMNRQIKLIGYQAGVKAWKKLTTYVGRKSIATNLSRMDGVDLKTVSKFLGHSRVSTTQRYYVDLPKELVTNQIANKF